MSWIMRTASKLLGVNFNDGKRMVGSLRLQKWSRKTPRRTASGLAYIATTT